MGTMRDRRLHYLHGPTRYRLHYLHGPTRYRLHYLHGPTSYRLHYLHDPPEDRLCGARVVVAAAVASRLPICSSTQATSTLNRGFMNLNPLNAGRR